MLSIASKSLKQERCWISLLHHEKIIYEAYSNGLDKDARKNCPLTCQPGRSPIKKLEMSLIKLIHETNNIDVKWPSEKLIHSIGFRVKAGNRIKDYLRDHGIEELTLRELMGLFLPPASNRHKSEREFWSNIPILSQPQFGIYLYDSALLTLSEAELGSAFRAEWMSRIYSLKLHELRHSPANKALERDRA